MKNFLVRNGQLSWPAWLIIGALCIAALMFGFNRLAAYQQAHLLAATWENLQTAETGSFIVYPDGRIYLHAGVQNGNVVLHNRTVDRLVLYEEGRPDAKIYPTSDWKYTGVAYWYGLPGNRMPAGRPLF